MKEIVGYENLLEVLEMKKYIITKDSRFDEL